jgi:hypothetical protein
VKSNPPDVYTVLIQRDHLVVDRWRQARPPSHFSALLPSPESILPADAVAAMATAGLRAWSRPPVRPLALRFVAHFYYASWHCDSSG